MRTMKEEAKLQNLNDFENKLLKRREIEIVVESESNPGFKSSKEIIVKQFKVPEDTVIVKNVKSEFGRHDFVVDAMIYDSKEDLEKLEGKQVEKKEEAPAEEAKVEEKPVEEKVEEAKPEEKKEESKEEKVEEKPVEAAS